MPSINSHICYRDTGLTLEKCLSSIRPRAIGIASAFVSANAISEFSDFIKRIGAKQQYLLAGLDNYITQPRALQIAMERNWKLRTIKGTKGIFHPKLIVCGEYFGKNQIIQSPSLFYVGSANFTRSGFHSNIECGFIGVEKVYSISAASTFSRFWNSGKKISRQELREYTNQFQQINSRRPSETVLGNGAENRNMPKNILGLKKENSPKENAFNPDYATTAWAELSAFTGDYTFQLEFPKASGHVLEKLAKRMVRLPEGKVLIRCEDGIVRPMTYRWYSDNSMFRLNIPNNVPDISWARTNHSGIGVVTYSNESGELTFRVVKPGNGMKEIIGRSFLLDTWGKTSKRLYGWY
jgi:HKD family nuclease